MYAFNRMFIHQSVAPRVVLKWSMRKCFSALKSIEEKLMVEYFPRVYDPLLPAYDGRDGGMRLGGNV